MTFGDILVSNEPDAVSLRHGTVWFLQCD